MALHVHIHRGRTVDRATVDANSREYEQARAKMSAATAVFRAAQDRYRKVEIGDKEFLEARAVHKAAEAEFDRAYAAAGG